jgi:sugar O-acyltransferase (sialic acid O-acetyltransferase NeuD family)
MTQKLIIIGAGGAGIEALWVARRINDSATSARWQVLGWVDEDPSRKGELVEELPILGTPADVCEEFGGVGIRFHCAVGDNFHRRRLVGRFESAGFEAATLIDPGAVIAASAKIGTGSYIGPLAVIAPRAQIGRHVMVNLSVSVGHHSHVGDFSQICPGARISGRVHLDEGVFVGSNGVVAPKVSVAEWATVAAGSLAVRDVPARATALGVPARTLTVPVPQT